MGDVSCKYRRICPDTAPKPENTRAAGEGGATCPRWEGREKGEDGGNMDVPSRLCAVCGTVAPWHVRFDDWADGRSIADADADADAARSIFTCTFALPHQARATYLPETFPGNRAQLPALIVLIAIIARHLRCSLGAVVFFSRPPQEGRHAAGQAPSITLTPRVPSYHDHGTYTLAALGTHTIFTFVQAKGWGNGRHPRYTETDRRTSTATPLHPVSAVSPALLYLPPPPLRTPGGTPPPVALPHVDSSPSRGSSQASSLSPLLHPPSRDPLQLGGDSGGHHHHHHDTGLRMLARWPLAVETLATRCEGDGGRTRRHVGFAEMQFSGGGGGSTSSAAPGDARSQCRPVAVAVFNPELLVRPATVQAGSLEMMTVAWNRVPSGGFMEVGSLRRSRRCR
ncbi:hypothetical protein CSOJ01_01002 [Colletotrichum sojae]|uniref:Uncharacterized protein n=1 Tax=Colletotrichum sojae TaxID=2175907 RepID=A0A8H6N4G0_9PEZI|nr:hypothetical protein CSOJ01_01002 [Colletotrichum sojae]